MSQRVTIPPPRILLVEDDPFLRDGLTRWLGRHGYLVDATADGREALSLCDRQDYDVVLSDISLPELDGLELLKAVRSSNDHVPVVLMTGGPAYETAVRAVEYGAYRYLEKPFAFESLRATLEDALGEHRRALLRRDAVRSLGGEPMLARDRDLLNQRFDRALDSLWIAYQPIVAVAERRVTAHEALLRTRAPAFRDPLAFLAAAERLGRIRELGRTIRARCARDARRLPPSVRLFVNLHTADLQDPELLSPAAPLSACASRVVLEISEETRLDRVDHLHPKLAELRAMGYRIAIDDLGAGYASLSSFVHLEPEVVKFDLDLTRDIHRSPTKQRVVRSLVDLCASMGTQVVAEGVEGPEQILTLSALGTECMQGYAFARPGAPFPAVAWPCLVA